MCRYMEMQLWRETLMPYHLAVDELLVKFRHIIKEYREVGMYSPIETVQGRVKTLSSILEKAERKNIPFEDIVERIDDIAGIRIMCQFVEDIDKVVEIIRNRTDMVVKKEKDYIRNIKPSGYRSYHIIIYYEVQTMHGSKQIQAEIQIRTLAMNFWAIIEHSLQYKYRSDMPEHIRKRLSASSEAILSLDNEMSSIHEEVVAAQNAFRQKANIVDDVYNNLQNLYSLVGQDEMMELQRKFYQLYHKGVLEDLISFGEELELLTRKIKHEKKE